MGNFSISHYAAIRVEPDAVRLRYLVDLAEIPTFQALQESRAARRSRSTLPYGPIWRARSRRWGTRSPWSWTDGASRSEVESSDLIFPPGRGRASDPQDRGRVPRLAAARGAERGPGAHLPGRATTRTRRLEGDRRERGARRDAGREHRARARPEPRADRLSHRPRREPAPAARGAGRLHARGRPTSVARAGPGARARRTARIARARGARRRARPSETPSAVPTTRRPRARRAPSRRRRPGRA